MSKSIVIVWKDPDLFFDACIGIVSQKNSFSGDVIWSWDDFVFLSADARISVELGIGDMNDRWELFDAQDHILFPLIGTCCIAKKYSFDKLFGKFL